MKKNYKFLTPIIKDKTYFKSMNRYWFITFLLSIFSNTLYAQHGSLSTDTTYESHILREVSVQTTNVRQSTESHVIQSIKNSHQVVSGISAQQIAKIQDREASEVIKRISGVTVIDNRFILVRGLSQRYNNVWINGTAVPSSEADSRAFSFDLIPSSQIENILILKSPSPEMPADFSGGFILIQTKESLQKNSYEASVNIGVNTNTQFTPFKYNQSNVAKVFGFDGGQLAIKGNIPNRVDNANTVWVNQLTQSGLNTNWGIPTKTPTPDIRLAFSANNRWWEKGTSRMYSTLAINYTNTNRTILNMQNNRFGIYNRFADESIYDYKYTDNIYTNNARLGAMLTVGYIVNNHHKVELRNLFNQLSSDRLTLREGYRNISTLQPQRQTEYNYNSRTMNTLQLAGKHNMNPHKIDWIVSYSYANKNQPDRRIITQNQDIDPVSDFINQFRLQSDDIRRDFIKLDEHIVSGILNYQYDVNLNIPTISNRILAGVYGEYRNRNYTNRTFLNRWGNEAPLSLQYANLYTQILIPQNYSTNTLYFYENTDNRDSYKANMYLLSAYVGWDFNWNKKLNICGGLRAEYNAMNIINYTSRINFNTKEKTYNYPNLFPSINASYEITPKQKIRFGYGMSINRPELRELSSSIYYDFDLFSDVAGNPKLKPALIQNVDLRYEYYPSSGEFLAAGVFYKHFTNPIESTYYDNGGSYTYSFENGTLAHDIGVEIDIRKNFDFVGLEDLMLIFNGAYIYTRVNFDATTSLQVNRPMQGQSPYIINAGLTYDWKKIRMNITAMYNRIGRRLMNVGRVDKTNTGQEQVNNSLPDIYEMPRDILDISVSKKIGKYVELRLAAQNALNSPVVFKQYPKFYDANGSLQTREQTTRYFKTGTTIMVTVAVNF